EPSGAAALLDLARERAVVDQSAANRRKTAERAQALRADEDTAARGSRRAARGLVRERERIEELEEEHERRCEQTLPERLAAQLGHDRHERRITLARLREQRRHHPGRELDVRIEQQRPRPL